MKKPTLKDIAEAVGVSVTTASLVLSNKGRISDSVRKAVVDAASKLGYDRAPVAALSGARPRIGILFSVDPQWAFVWGFVRPIVAEIERLLGDRGYDVHLVPIHDTAADTGIEERILRGSYSGIFSIHYVDERMFGALERERIEVVVIMNSKFQDRFHSILVDDFQSSYEGTRHLLELGHRDILYAGTDRINLPKLTTDRYYGFCKALEEFGMPVTPTGYLSCEAADTQHLDASLREVFARTRKPTAVFAIDDDMAIRIVALLGHSGMQVPRDLSIIAPGDLLNYDDPFVTPISTLRTDTSLMGRLASDMMLRLLAGEQESVHAIKIKQQLVQRGSTKPLASGRVPGKGKARAEPRERFLHGFTHEDDAPPGRWLGASREFITKACIELNMDEEQFRLRIRDDLRWVSPDPIGQGGRTVDAFGIERRGIGYGQPTEHPLRDAPTIERLREYPWPDPSLEETDGIRSRIAPLAERFAIAGGNWSPFWHDAVDLVGMETMAFLMYDNPVFVETMLHRIVDYYVAINTRVFEEAGDLIDLIFVRNDFGTQTGPLLGVDHFDRFISPCIKRIVEAAHRYDIRVLFHSSGAIRPLLPSLLATGIDALHALQPDCAGMHPAAIKGEVGHRVVLSGGIDARGALLHGSAQEVRRTVLETLDTLARGGGYLAAPSVDAITADVPVGNVLAMYDAIDEWHGSG